MNIDLDENYISDNDVCLPKKHQLKVDFKEKFNKLKEKREKFVQKSLKKQQKAVLLKEKSDKVVVVDENSKLKKHILNYNEHIKKLDWSQLDDDDEAKNEKVNLERDLDMAIKSKNIEIAEELNEKLVDYDSKLHINYAVNAYNYENKSSADKSSNKNKTKLRWQFEAKERWEAKANM